jgi:xanthine dehydrogenase FAD-binding subunit
MLQYTDYYMPDTVEQLFDLIDKEKQFDIVSGGTDIFAKEKTLFDSVNTAIDISSIKEFGQVRISGHNLVVGANVKIQRFLDDPVLIENAPLLRYVACYFADQQIRECATIGGNVANASPTGDMIPALVALNATVQVISRKNNQYFRKDIPMQSFIVGLRKTALKENEVIESFTFSILKGYGCSFKKVGLRRSLCISTVNAAFLIDIDQDHVCRDVRAVFGAVRPVPTRLLEAEEFLKGKTITAENVKEAEKYIPDTIVQSRSRIEYRNLVVRNFWTEGIFEAIAAAGGAPENHSANSE